MTDVELAAPAGMEMVVAGARGLRITDQDDYELAAELLAQLKAVAKEIEESRQAITKPLNASLRAINQQAKEALGDVPEVTTRLRAAMSEFLAWQREVREAAEKQAQTETGQAVVDPSSLPAVSEKRVQTSTGSVSTRTRWTFQVTDPFALAKAQSKSKKAWEEFGDIQLVMPAVSNINHMIKTEGLREYPGLRIYETDDVVTR